MKKRSVILGLLTMGLVTTTTGCSSVKSISSATGSTDSKKTATKKTSGFTMKRFDQITLGDGSGTTLDSLKQDLGNPTSTSTSAVQTQTLDLNTWIKGLGTSLAVGFSNGHAISKHINGLTITRKDKISLDTFNQIQNGQSEDDVKKLLGEPNGINTSSLAGTTITILTYTSGIKGNIGSNVTVTLTNGAITIRKKIVNIT